MTAFSDFHLTELARRAISADAAASAGVLSLQTPNDLQPGMPARWADHLPALAFPWTDGDGRIEWQLRPDLPPVDELTGRPRKYLGRARGEGYRPTLWVAKRGGDDGRRILVEGSCQTVAAAAYAGPDDWVIGMFGCYGWSADGAAIPDLWALQGRRVFVAMDGDMWTNPDVWHAGVRLLGELRNVGADDVRWVKMSNGAKSPGLDDVLAKQPDERRAVYLDNLVTAAITEKFPKSRTPRADEPAAEFFDDHGLKVATTVRAVRARQPVALTAEAARVACYAEGRFRVDTSSFTAAMFQLLGERYRNDHRANTETALASQLAGEGLILPESPVPGSRPLVNVRNGMLDLNTAQLLPHDPRYLSSFQLPVHWDPRAACPTYDRWIADVLPEQGRQLEELMWSMLDSSAIPTKAGFLYGPTRSGKGTFLRIASAVAGSENTSNVTLHQLCTDQFAAANLYGKQLNAAGDLSAAHIGDVSVFKQLTGEDQITANRKYGSQFNFRNQALFLFAANEIPSVSERSNAYLNRMVPFYFGESFDGAEDPALERAMMVELPGILRRWVIAGLELLARGRRLEGPAHVTRHFSESSDRVRRFISEECKVFDPAEQKGSTVKDLYAAFKWWASEQGGGAMNRSHFAERLLADDRVREVRVLPHRTRGVNVQATGHGY